MDIMLLIICALLIFAIVVLWGQIRDLRSDLLQVRSELASTKQARIRSFVQSTATPHVDAKARTVTRDSHDLPATGRMSQGVHRKKTNARNNPDGGLPDSPGPEAT